MATATNDDASLDNLVPGLGELAAALREETAADNELLAQLEARHNSRGEDKPSIILAETLGGIQARLERERAEIARKEGVLRRFGMDPKASTQAGRLVAVAVAEAPAEKPAPAKDEPKKKGQLTKEDVLACIPEKGTIAGPALIKKVNEAGFPKETSEAIYGLLFELVYDGTVMRTGQEGSKVFRRA